MTTRSSVSRKASACIEALDSRTLMSGELDRSFRGVGGGLSGYDIRAVAVQPNNYTVLASVEPGADTARITRLTTGGTQDGAFGKKGNVFLTGIKANKIDSVTVLANGKILIGGQNYVRLNANGTLDTTFGGGDGVAPSQLAGDRRANQAITVYADGSYVELGNNSPTDKNYLFKYKADGSLDKSFGNGGSFAVASLGGERTGAVSLDSAGRVYVAFENTDSTLCVARLTAAGKVDTTWGTKGVAKGSQGTITTINAMAVLTDGRVLASWTFSTSSDYNGFDLFTSAGKFTNAGGNSAISINGGFSPDTMTLAKDGSVYIGGTYSVVNGNAYEEPDFTAQTYLNAAVVHLNKDLSLDTKYSSNRDGIGGYGEVGRSTYYIGSAVAANGSVVIVGRNFDGQGSFARLTGNGVANRVSYTVTPKAVVINGSDSADSFTFVEALDDKDGKYDRGIYLDAPLGSIHSADMLLFDALSPTQTFTLNLKGGDDRVDARDSNFPVTINGGAGNDYVNGTHAADVINGGDGDDNLYADLFAYGATIHGDAGNDSVMVGREGRGYGDGGNDNVTGYHNASLYGGDGDDLLGHATSQGYPGLLDGGAGDDTAVYISGDILKDIEHAKLVS